MLREENMPMNDFMRIDAALAGARNALSATSESPRLDAELLLARALDVRRSFLFAHGDQEMDIAAVERFNSAVGKRAEGCPLAYITGEKEFWSMTLLVTPATLVPRPETETLVDQALQRISRQAACRVLDLGTGSGAIALAVASERPLCEIVATDISEAALAVARENARRHALPNIEFLCGEWTAPVRGQHFDIVVTNPPYICETDPHLQNLKHEPRDALVAGNDGLDAIRAVVAEVGGLLVAGGTLLVEHGHTQRAEIADLLRDNGFSSVDHVNDLAGHTRVTIASSQ